MADSTAHHIKEISQKEVASGRMARAKKAEAEKDLVRVMVRPGTWVFCTADKVDQVKKKFLALFASPIMGRRSGGKLPGASKDIPKKKKEW